MSDLQFKALHKEADAVGKAAADACVPQAMVVVGGGREYHVPEGVCGFAWVHFAGNKPFGRWAKKAGLARPAYSGGLDMWVGAYGQSMARKEAYARAYAQVLNANGVDEAYADSRMD
jgi:hypothetical protein